MLGLTMEGQDMLNGYGDVSKASLLTKEEREQSVVITDPAQPDNPIIFVSEEFEKQTGYTPEETLGRNCRFLQGAETNPQTIEAIGKAIERQTEITADILNYKKDGTKFWNRLRIRPLYGDHGEVMFFAGVQYPIDASEVLAGATATTQDKVD